MTVRAFEQTFDPKGGRALTGSVREGDETSDAFLASLAVDCSGRRLPPKRPRAQGDAPGGVERTRAHD